MITSTKKPGMLLIKEKIRDLSTNKASNEIVNLMGYQIVIQAEKQINRQLNSPVWLGVGLVIKQEIFDVVG